MPPDVMLPLPEPPTTLHVTDVSDGPAMVAVNVCGSVMEMVGVAGVSENDIPVSEIGKVTPDSVSVKVTVALPAPAPATFAPVLVADVVMRPVFEETHVSLLGVSKITLLPASRPVAVNATVSPTKMVGAV